MLASLALRGIVWSLGLGLVPGLAPTSVAQQPNPFPPVSYANDVLPVLTRAGCNLGVCHAKAGGGQNGFQLSLLGFEPGEDHEALTLADRGRRLSVGEPERSLILRKAAGQVPHGGGVRIRPDSPGYATLRDWIAQGAPADLASAPKITRLEIEPAKATLAPGGQVQLAVRGHYADGTVRDVTPLALFESNETALAEVTPGGLVTAQPASGRVAVMVRFQGLVTVANVVLPLGAPVADLPSPANLVDEHLLTGLRELGIPPSPPCDDSTFLRRVTLDIAGRLPTVAESEAFGQSPAATRRADWVEQLLQGSDYADYFAGKWAAVLKNRRDDASDMQSNFAFHAWVRDSLLANKPYDQWVRELLAATGTVQGNPPVAWYKRVKDPKQQLEDVAQLFLGVRMQCAQCHHHPFERWSQDDYYAFAAFFSQVGRKASATRGEDQIFHQRGVAKAVNVKTGRELPPAALGDSPGAIGPGEDPRLKLADWMRGAGSKYFATALVNRYWKHFFGRGLVEPEDDLRESNPATNPELLDALSRSFVDSGYDLKALVRLLVLSRAYQFSAQPNEFNAGDLQAHSRFYPRRLPAEVLLDAIDQVAETQTDFANLPPGTRAIALPDNSYNQSSAFLRVFGRPQGESVCECERVQSSSLQQSLHLINSGEIRGKLAHPNGRAERLAKETRPVEQRIGELYRAALGREPSANELHRATAFLAETRTDAQGNPLEAQAASREAWQDLVWAVINTKEFLFNH